MTMTTIEDRSRAYLARRILRAVPNGPTHKKLLKQADAKTLRMVEVYPIYSARWCVAKAEQLVIDHVNSDNI